MPPDAVDPTDPTTDAPDLRTGPSAPERPPTALPSVTARALGFVAIVVSGAIGAFIGWGFTDLQCTGDCGTPDAVGALIGAVIGAGGVAVVVVLALRAMGEWRTVQRRPTGPERPAIPQSKRPRVR